MYKLVSYAIIFKLHKHLSTKHLMPRILFFLFIFLTFFVSNALAWDEYSGWWYVPGKDGTGVSVEVNGDDVFVALYDYYEDVPSPFWVSAYGQIERNVPQNLGTVDILEANVSFWTGWPLGQIYQKPKSFHVGNLRMIFLSSDEAVLESTTYDDFLDPSQGYETKRVHLYKFMPRISPGMLDPRDINGWMWDPNYDGMGFFLEARGNTLFMVWYHYDEYGYPTWMTCSGPLTPQDTHVFCEMTSWSGGSMMGAETYISPTGTSKGQAELTFSQDGGIILNYSGQAYHLFRFLY